VRCPSCSTRFTVPEDDAEGDRDRNADEKDEGDEGEPARPRRSSRQPSANNTLVPWVIAGAAVLLVVLLGGGVAVFMAFGSRSPVEAEQRPEPANPIKDGGNGGKRPDAKQDSTAERDRDYLDILETLLLIDGAANGKKFWLSADGDPAFKDLRGAEATNVMARAFDPHLMSEESASVEKRKEFATSHGMDSKVWRAEFVKRYPERETMNDEIRVLVRRLCDQRLADISGHLIEKRVDISKELFKKADADPALNARMARNGPKIIEDEWHEYRVRYLEKQGPKLAKEVQEAVNMTDSLVRLRAKLGADRGR
jgi:hypothetical protein